MRWTALILLLGVLAACGGSNTGSDATEILAAQSAGAEMGSLEDEAIAHLESLTAALLSAPDDPDAAISAVSTWLMANEAELRANSDALRERLESLEGSERRAYENGFSEYMNDATYAWADARDAFFEAYPDHQEALEGALERFGQPAPEEPEDTPATEE